MISAEAPTPPSSARPSRSGRVRRALLWAALLALLGVAQSLLVVLTIRHEATRAQDDAEATVAEIAGDLRRQLQSGTLSVQSLAWEAGSARRSEAEDLLKAHREIRRIEFRGRSMVIAEAVDTPFLPRLFVQMARRDLSVEADLSCTAARRAAAPMFSRSYFVPLADGQGAEIIDLCVPVQDGGQDVGYVVASFQLTHILEAVLPPRDARRFEFSFIEGDGTRLARAGLPRGSGVYRAERIVDLPGNPLQLRADAAAGRPSLIPNLATALVLGLSLALFALVFALARDVRRRAEAERALAEALAFRSAMEDSLSTGLRARDLQARITYVNPAFCAMVGFSFAELQRTPPPYWPPEFGVDYARRQSGRLLGDGGTPGESREGFETVFMRENGERFPVMIYEAPLVDGEGRHTGWMSAVLDLSAQRRVEEISRQQQDRLQATARLATVGEMASLLSHELNQPLAAIASYASGSLNLIEQPDAGTTAMLKQALERIAEQAERAGRVIKSVHDFVRRREQSHETIGADLLLEAVLPLARMQAHKSGTRIEIELPMSSGRAPRVRCDRTMVEQVLLNLARNGIQAMESGTANAERVLTLRVRQTHARWVTFSVIDAGPGIAPEVAAQLFTPFFTTRAEGMGLGLSLCRTVIEQHGGALDFGPRPGGSGTQFRFTLPAAPSPAAESPVADTAHAETPHGE